MMIMTAMIIAHHLVNRVAMQQANPGQLQYGSLVPICYVDVTAMLLYYCDFR